MDRFKRLSQGLLVLGIFLVGAFIIMKVNDKEKQSSEVLAATTTTKDLKILKSEVTSKAKFYPYKSGKIYMEVIAVKASDGTIRTALNTCQVCYDSGRGFYTQQRNELICNNCGNRFKIDQIEKTKFGCNPIPILSGDKTDNGKYIIISSKFLAKNRAYFENWKR